MGSSLDELVDSFGLHLRAANLSPRTVRSYADAVSGLGAFLAKAGLSSEHRQLRRRDIEAYIADQLDRWSPATAANRCNHREPWGSQPKRLVSRRVIPLA
jgi:hypothetical protein